MLKLLQPKLASASDAQLKDLPPVPLFTCDFEILRHPTLDTVLSGFQPDESAKPASLAQSSTRGFPISPSPG